MSSLQISVAYSAGSLVIQGTGQTLQLTTPAQTQVLQLGTLSAAAQAQLTSIQTSYNAIANGTATDAGALTGSETVPLSRGAGLLQKSLSAIADFVLGQLTFTNYAGLRAYTGVRTYAVITATGISGQFAQLASATGLSDNGGTIIFDGAGRAWQRVFAGQSIDAEWFGWVGGEPGAVLNAAQAAAVYHGCGHVTFRSPNYSQTTPIIATSGVVIRGPALGTAGTIRVVAGTTITSQYETPNFEAQYASQPTMASQGVVRDFGLENVLLDGNCGQTQNTPVTTNALRGMGFRVYGARPRFRNVFVMRQPGIGFYSNFTSSPTYVGFGSILATDSKDGSCFENIVVEDTQYENFVFQGPSDISVREIHAGWPANSLWSTTYLGKKSLMFPKGRLAHVAVTAGGTAFTQAGVAWTIATDATTPPTIQPVVVSGAIDHVIVLTPGSADGTYCTITFTGDGTGATATAYLNNWISGGVIFNAGAEFQGIVHCYGNAQGYAVDVRNDDSGLFPRFDAEFIMGESSLGGVSISDLVEYSIGRCDTHANGYGSGPPFPSLRITSTRGGAISSWKEKRTSVTGTGAAACVIRGANNRVHGNVQGFSAYAGNVCVVGGQSNKLDVTVANMGGYALVTDWECSGADIHVISNSNAGVWNNYANATTITSINSNVSISAYGSVPVGSAYTGLNNLSTGAWRNIRINDKRSDTGGLNFSAQALFGSVDLTNTAEQAITMGHNIVRTPQGGDVGQPQVKPNISASFGTGGLQYAYISAVTSNAVTVKVKLAAAGSGTATLQVNIG